MNREPRTASQRSALLRIFHGIVAIKYSLHGFIACFRDETAFRLECAFAIPHFVLIFFIHVDLWIKAVLGVLWLLLVAIELLNSSIEATVDLISLEKSDLAKKAKDCGSAAVMVLIVALVTCWAIAVFIAFGGC